MHHEKPDPSNDLTRNENDKNRLFNAKRVAWGLVGIAVLVTVWGISEALPRLVGKVGILTLLAEAFFRMFPVIFAVLAALIINRQPANFVGWLMAIPVLGGIITFVSESYFHGVVAPPIQPSFFFLLMLWVNSTSWTLFIFPIILIPLFFPDGRPPSPRWNWVLYYAALLLLIFYTLAGLAAELAPDETTWTIPNPIGFLREDFFERIFGLPWTIALFILVTASVAALVTRFRSGTHIQKAQIKWVVYASFFFGTVYVMLLPFSFNEHNQTLKDLINILFAMSLSVIPIGISIAILHYRLWDIDFVINRSLVYGALTALLAVFLGGGLFIVSRLFQNSAGGPLLAVAGSAAIFGAIFQPARRQLQQFVDRRFYHIEIDYQKTPPAFADPTAAQVLRQTHFGVYQDLELIGHGGMAEVFRSVHPTLGVPVAIKILPTHLAAELEFRQRFTREAQVVAKLDHPNIVRIFDSGEQDGRHYMVMEYILGQDLEQLIKKNGRLPLSRALGLLKQLALALDYAHAEGFVHRDIKPSNVLLEESAQTGSRAVLTDFGLAKIINSHTVVTRAGNVLGTFNYIAPEQIQEASNVNGQADIYALGVMAYYMLTGELPFSQNNTGALLIAHLNQPPPNACEIAPNIPYHIAAAIQRAMAKKPEERFATATELAMEMDRP